MSEVNLGSHKGERILIGAFFLIPLILLYLTWHAPGQKAAAPTPTPTTSAGAAANPTPVPSSAPPVAAAVSTFVPTPRPTEDPQLADLPSFVPAYPGATTISFSSSGLHEATRGSYLFSTPDKPDAVGAFYKDAFSESGLVVSVNVSGNDHIGSSYTLIADGGTAGRSVSLKIEFRKGRSVGSIGFVGK